MPDAKLRFRFREPNVDTNQPISNGTIKIEGFEIEVLGGPNAECDGWDAGFGELVQSYATGAPVISIPAFPNRKFRQSYIFVNSAAGIDEPQALEGKRVGIMFWGNTAGVWARGALQNYYEVDLTKINWVSTRPDPAPAAPDIRRDVLDTNASLDELLVSGEIDAVIGPDVLPSIASHDPRVRRLFPDWRSVEQAYYRDTGIFPTSHAVTLRQEYVAEHPDAPVALLEAFRKARDFAIHKIEGPDPHVLVASWLNASLAEQRALMGDHYWAYNLTEPHNVRTLEAITQFAHQQGLTPNRLDYRTFFHPEAAALEGF